MVAERDEQLTVALPSGAVTVSAAYGRPPGAWASVLVAHGAGTTHVHPFVVGLTRALRDAGVATMRFNFPYSEARRRMPGPAAHAINTWTAAVVRATELGDGEPVWATGRSYGGRMASMAAAAGAIEPAGLAYLGYPLHPPGRPDQLRTAHLPAITMPQLFVSGRSDPFVDPHGQLEDAVASCRDATLHWIDGGHSFEVKGHRRPQDEIGADLAPLVVEFLQRPSRESAPGVRPAGGAG